MTDSPKGMLGTLNKAIDVLELLAQHRDGLQLAEIARTLQYNTSTAHHLVGTLKARGFVSQDSTTKRYALGARLLHLATHYIAGTDVYSAGEEPTRELRDRSGETSYLTVLQGTDAVSIIEMAGHNPIQVRRTPRAGAGRLHCTASGKLLLAFLAADRRATLLDGMPLQAFTPHTIVELPRLQDEFAAIRRQGYALDLEEDYIGICCVAAPIYSNHGECVATVSVSFPSAGPARVDELTGMVVDAAAKISANLGYSVAGGSARDRRVAELPR